MTIGSTRTHNIEEGFPPCGMGYQPSLEELRMLRQPRLKKRLGSSKTVSRDSLNGRFIQEGEVSPFVAFPNHGMITWTRR